MYIVKDKSGKTVALCSRPEDANAWVSTKLDNAEYIVEKQGLTDFQNATRQNEGIKKSSN
jgi:hypothetical protein